MKKEIIITAPTVDEALKRAAAELGALDSADLEYEILEMPKRGILGIGSAPAKLRVSYTCEDEDAALAFVKKIVGGMGIEGEVSASELADGEKRITINGEGAGVLIGHHGETLDSLQYLTNLALGKANKNKGEGKYVRVSVDVENYREKREETLRSLARKMADRVLKYKKNVMLEPMNPYERRIIHSEIQEIPGVSTNSIGPESSRKIVIFPSDKAGGERRQPEKKRSAI